jgi:hypothetical protein
MIRTVRSRSEIYKSNVSTYAGTEEHKLPASKLLDGENGDPRSDEVLRAVTSSQKHAQELRQADTTVEN